MKNLVKKAVANTTNVENQKKTAARKAEVAARKENRETIRTEVRAIRDYRNSLKGVIRNMIDTKNYKMLSMLGCTPKDSLSKIKAAVMENMPIIPCDGTPVRRTTRYAVIDDAYVAGYVYAELKDWLQAVKLAAENASIKHIAQVKLTEEDMEKFYYKSGEVMQDVPAGDVEFIGREEYSEHMKK